MTDCTEHPNCRRFDVPHRGVALEGITACLVADMPAGRHQLVGLDLVADPARLTGATICLGEAADRILALGFYPGTTGRLVLIVPCCRCPVPSEDCCGASVARIWYIGPSMAPIILRHGDQVRVNVVPEREVPALALRVHLVAI